MVRRSSAALFLLLLIVLPASAQFTSAKRRPDPGPMPKNIHGIVTDLRAFRGKAVYVTLDIDVVDPAYAPGTGTPQVGGLTSMQILELVRALRGLQIVGCDLVEVSPPYDTGEITSLLAANLLFELLCVL